MHSFCKKFPEFAVTKAQGQKPMFLFEPGDWRSGRWVEASMASRDPVPFSALHVSWGRRVHFPTFGYEKPGHPYYSSVTAVVVRHMPERSIESKIRELLEKQTLADRNAAIQLSKSFGRAS